MQELESILATLDKRPAFEGMPRFPMAILPPTVREYVENSALATRVRPEMIAAPLLAFTGAVIGVQLRFEVSPGWFERPVLWISLAATTGSGKSPALRAARLPLDILQHKLYEQWRRNFHAWAAQDQQTTPEPLPTHLLTTDPTLDALTQQLAHRNGIVLLRDELYGIIRAMNRNGGDDRQKFLPLWSSETIAPLRKSERVVIVHDPVVAVVGGVQPALIPKFRSQEADGMLERFLPMFVVNGGRYWSDSTSANASAPNPQLVAHILESLLNIPVSPPDPHGTIVRMTTQAESVWRNWYNANVDLQRDAHRHLEGYYAKLPGHLARFALILHALWNSEAPTSPITETTMRHAIELAEFFRIHMHNVIPLLDKRPSIPRRPNLRQRIITTLRESPTPDGWITRTDLIRSLSNPALPEFDISIRILGGTNQIEERKRTEPGSRKPRQEFRLPRPTTSPVPPQDIRHSEPAKNLETGTTS